MSEHKQAPIYFEDGAIFEVDEKLQSLIQFYVDNGFETFNSCQDNVRGTTWIQYELDDWRIITDIAFRTEDRELYDYIVESCEVLLLSSEDGYLDENDEYYLASEELIWSASVRFPKEDLPYFEELIRNTIIFSNEEDE